jgi:hypothetical protein
MSYDAPYKIYLFIRNSIWLMGAYASVTDTKILTMSKKSERKILLTLVDEIVGQGKATEAVIQGASEAAE